MLRDDRAIPEDGADRTATEVGIAAMGSAATTLARKTTQENGARAMGQQRTQMQNAYPKNPLTVPTMLKPNKKIQ